MLISSYTIGWYFFLIDYKPFSSEFLTCLKYLGSGPGPDSELFPGSGIRYKPFRIHVAFTYFLTKIRMFCYLLSRLLPLLLPLPHCPSLSHTAIPGTVPRLLLRFFFRQNMFFVFVLRHSPRSRQVCGVRYFYLCIGLFFFLEVGKSCFLCTKLFDLFRKLNDK